MIARAALCTSRGSTYGSHAQLTRYLPDHGERLMTIQSRHNASSASSSTTAQRPMEVWEEVELNRPRAPTLEGYTRPKNAPEQFDITRSQFHEFMKGRPGRFSKEFRIFLTGVGIAAFVFGEMAFTVWKLKPEDFAWVEEERERAAKARAKLDERMRLAKVEEETSP